MQVLPVNISIEMLAEKPVVLPSFTGYISRGLLLHILRIVDPSLSASLHEADIVKPYSVTPLRFRSKGKTEDGYILDPSFPCRVDFRFLIDDIARRMLEYFYSNSSFLIYDVPFKFSSIHVKSECYSDLLEKADEPVVSLRLSFLTPTYLSIMGTDYHHMFPDPMRVFLHLIRLWNNFSDSRCFSEGEIEEYQQWLTKNVGVSMYDLKTRIAYMREKKAIGFIGWTVYEMRIEDEWNRITRTLAMYAEYSNIGGNRTGGFGVTRVRSIK